MRFENIVSVNINMSQTTWCHIPDYSIFIFDNSKIVSVLLESVIVKSVDKIICSAALWFLQVAVRCSTNLTNCTVRVVTWASEL